MTKMAQELTLFHQTDLGKVHCFKGPSQPHLCFSLQVRDWLLFYLQHVKTKEITVNYLR